MGAIIIVTGHIVVVIIGLYTGWWLGGDAARSGGELASSITARLKVLVGAFFLLGAGISEYSSVLYSVARIPQPHPGITAHVMGAADLYVLAAAVSFWVSFLFAGTGKELASAGSTGTGEGKDDVAGA